MLSCFCNCLFSWINGTNSILPHFIYWWYIRQVWKREKQNIAEAPKWFLVCFCTLWPCNTAVSTSDHFVSDEKSQSWPSALATDGWVAQHSAISPQTSLQKNMCFCMLSLHLTVGVKRDRKWGKETRGITHTKWLRLPGFEPVQGIRTLTRLQGHHF